LIEAFAVSGSRRITGSKESIVKGIRLRCRRHGMQRRSNCQHSKQATHHGHRPAHGHGTGGTRPRNFKYIHKYLIINTFMKGS
jgi:hypothetical protein